MNTTTPATPTPGPWHVSTLNGRTVGPSRFLVCAGTTIPQLQAVAIVTLREDGETDANAQLIAAAPDLLAALHLAVTVIRSWESMGLFDQAAEHSWRQYQQSPEMQTINAALAKAEGRS